MKTREACYLEARQQNLWHRLHRNWKRNRANQQRSKYLAWARFQIIETEAEKQIPQHQPAHCAGDPGPVSGAGEVAKRAGAIIRCGAIQREPLCERPVLVEVIVNE